MDLWLTLITPHPASRAAWRELDPEHAAALHRRVMSLLPEQLGDSPRRAAGVLHRIEQGRAATRVLVQSATPPDPGRLPAGYGHLDTTPLATHLGRLRTGTRVRYRIVANTTRKLGPHTTAGRPRQLVPLAGQEAQQWWMRHAQQAGLRLDAVDMTTLPSARVQRGNPGQPTRYNRTRFDGAATVTDPDALTAALAEGIGRAKNYGCGLLTVVPLP